MTLNTSTFSSRINAFNWLAVCSSNNCLFSSSNMIGKNLSWVTDWAAGTLDRLCSLVEGLKPPAVLDLLKLQLKLAVVADEGHSEIFGLIAL
jgi:hypothetical protein